MSKHHRNPSPPNDDFKYEGVSVTSYTPEMAYSCEPFISYVDLIHPSLVTTPPASDVEETEPVSLETPVSLEKPVSLATHEKARESAGRTVKKEIVHELDTTRATVVSNSPEKVKERPKTCSEKRKKIINYTDSDSSDSEDGETSSTSSDGRDRSHQKKSSSDIHRKKKDSYNFTKDKRSDREEGKKRLPTMKDVDSDGSSGDSRCRRGSNKPRRSSQSSRSQYSSPAGSSRYQSPAGSSRYQSPERSRRHHSTERSRRHHSSEKSRRHESSERSSRRRSPSRRRHSPERSRRRKSPERSRRHQSPEGSRPYRSTEGSHHYQRQGGSSQHQSPERSSPQQSPETSNRQGSPQQTSQSEDISKEEKFRTGNPKEEYIKTEFSDSKDDFCGGLDIFYCNVCQLSLNSDLTFNSHMQGKRHAKAVKAREVHEVARGSLAPQTVAIEDIPRYDTPPAGIRRIPVNDMSKIQTLCNEVRKCPLPGLDKVLEIRSFSGDSSIEMQTTYLCELCNAPCASSSIMPHLTGFKHQLRFVKEIEPRFYYDKKDVAKNLIERDVLRILVEHEKRMGRQLIKVVKDVPDRSAPIDVYSQPGPSWNPPYCQKIPRDRLDNNNAAGGPSDADNLDTSKSDFYCRICEAHMNNLNMWEAHVRGKRHLKSKKKVPGESKGKIRALKAPDHTRSHLEDKLRNISPYNEVVVGLKFIKETQSVNGDFYNCFLCSSCSTDLDIIDHIFSIKHKVKYLRKLEADGIDNAISTISDMEIGNSFRDSLIEDECRKFYEIYGPGKPEVFKKLDELRSSAIW